MAKQATVRGGAGCPIPVLTFRRMGLGRMVAMLGENEVGEVVELATRRNADAAGWLVRFFPLDRHVRQAPNELAACRGVERAVNEWLYGAGALDPGAGVRVELPDDLAADAERATA